MKRLCLLALFVGSMVFGLSMSDAQAQSRRNARKQHTDVISYQPAAAEQTPTTTTTPPSSTSPADATSNSDRSRSAEEENLNATVVRNTSEKLLRLTPAQQLEGSLLQRRADLQEQIDRLGAELKTARGSRARKITNQLDVLADQMAQIDRRLELIPQTPTIPEAYSSGKPFRQFVDSLVDLRIEEDGYVKGPSNTPATDNYVPTDTRAALASVRISYRVQLAVTHKPNQSAFNDLSGVEMVKRADGRYAYYYGDYDNYDDARSTCLRLRNQAVYRDAFVVAMQGQTRISIEEAARLKALQ